MKKISITILAMVFSHSTFAESYCTTTNWDKLARLTNENANEYNQLMKTIEEHEIKTNSAAFIHNRYTLEKYAKMWDMNNEVDKASVESFITDTQTRIVQVQKLVTQLKPIKKDARNLEHNWELLADYCYEEKGYDSYKPAHQNHEIATSNLNTTTKMIKALIQAKTLYQTELEFFIDTKELSK